MAIAHPASTKPGTQTQSEGQPPISNSDAGVELQVTPPAEVQVATSGGEVSVQAAGSSASHLTGLSQSDIKIIDEKFQRLLDTVHANRPADDLEIIRKAWQFCLQQHEGQTRASGEPYVIHPLEVGQVINI